MTIIDTTTITPLTHSEAMDLLGREFEQTIAMLRSLDDHEWTMQTDCPDWDIRRMYLHVLGASEAGASMRENVHQLRKAYAHRRRHDGPLEAALSGLQVREREDLSAAEVVERLEKVAPKTVKGRRRTPGLMRNHAKLKVDGPVHETWKLGYLIDTIYLRDMWMHRVDTSHATGRPLVLTSDHDGRIIADVVGEWGRRHGRPFVLELEGAAGGTFAQDADAPDAERVTIDAVEFCRTLAGRNPATGLLTTIVPF